MKNCSTCSVILTSNNAYYKDKAKTKFQCYCKSCLHEKQKQRWIKRKNEAIQYKGGKCQDCNILYPYPVMEFHHLDPNEKDFDWNDLRYYGSKELIQNELDKCVLLCSNCHRMRHHSDELLKQNKRFSSIKKKYFCIDCNKEVTKGSKKCTECHLIYKAKLDKEKVLNRKQYFCLCGKELSSSKSKECQQCFNKKLKHMPHKQKIEWPTKEELEKLVWEIPTVKLSEQLGVSDVAIAKRCKKLGIAKPERGYWEKIYHSTNSKTLEHQN